MREIVGRMRKSTAYVVFHVVLTGSLACPLTHSRPNGPWLTCVICEHFGPREVRLPLNASGRVIRDYASDPRD